MVSSHRRYKGLRYLTLLTQLAVFSQEALMACPSEVAEELWTFSRLATGHSGLGSSVAAKKTQDGGFAIPQP